MSDDESLFDFNIRKLVEFVSRTNQSAPDVKFGENDLVATDPDGFRILPGVNNYFNQQPGGVFAVATAPTGERIILQGGSNDLASGHYTLQYVDKTDKSHKFEGVRAKTKDNADFVLEVMLTYKVVNPIRVLETQNPLGALFESVEAAIKSYIRSHTHEELISSAENDQRMTDADLGVYITNQLQHTPLSKAFLFIKCIITERKGDPEMMRIRKTRQMQEMQNKADREALLLKRQIDQERKSLDQLMAEWDRLIRKIKVDGELDAELVLFEIKRMGVELDAMKKLPGYQHEENLKRYDAQVKAIEAIMQGFSRSANDPQVLHDLMSSLDRMPRTQSNQPIGHDKPKSNPQIVDSGTTDDPIINLMNPKKARKRNEG